MALIYLLTKKKNVEYIKQSSKKIVELSHDVSDFESSISTVLVGVKYGISERMAKEILIAKKLNMIVLEYSEVDEIEKQLDKIEFGLFS